jgi:membrane-associated phospholipid phosphatase
VTFTAALFMQRTGQKLAIRAITWAFFVVTVLATIYFGWHYLADDIAGIVIGWASVSLGAWASGNRGRRKRRGLAPVDEQPVQPVQPVQPATVTAPGPGGGSGSITG